MSKKVYLLINKTSGSNFGSVAFENMKKALNKVQLPYESFISEYSGQLTQLARKLANHIQNRAERYIVVIGGDGSLNQALNGVKESHYPTTPIAYLPAGTGDDFARALKLTKNATELVNHLVQGPKIEKVDCGHYKYLNHDISGYFVNNLGIGFDAYVVAQTNQAVLKRRFNKLHIGNLSYGIKVLNALANQDTFSVTVKANGETHTFDNAYLVTTTNHPYFGGGVPLLPQANVHSNALDTVVVEKPNTAKFLYLFIKMFINGSHVRDPHFHYFESKKIEVSTSGLEFGQLDGEELGSKTFNIVFELDKFNLLI